MSPDLGSRRAAVLTVTVSALLVTGGFVVAHQAGDQPPRPAHSTATPTPSEPTGGGTAPVPGG